MQSATIVLIAALLSSAAFAQEPTPADPATEVERPRVSSDQLLLAEAKQEQAVWIGQGEAQSVALYLPEQRGEQAGGIIVIASGDQNPASQGQLNLLRTALPLHGWHTLAITLLNPEPEQPPERTLPIRDNLDQLPARGEDDGAGAASTEPNTVESNASASEPAPTAATTTETLPITAQNRQRIDQAINYLQGKGLARLVVVVAGGGARMVVDEFQRSAPPKTVRALVMIDASDHSTDFDYPSFIRTTPLPILDIYRSGSGELAEEAIRNRKLAARFKPRGRYTQLQLMPSGTTRPTMENRLIKRIRGWLENHAP